jgi:hypothetical protein
VLGVPLTECVRICSTQGSGEKGLEIATVSAVDSKLKMQISTTLPCAEVDNAMQLSLSVYSQRIQRAKRRALGEHRFY